MPPQVKVNDAKEELLRSSASDESSDEEMIEAPTLALTSFFYLSPSASENMPHFQYKGEDRSLLYHYVLSPLASFCVNHLTPRTIAPNTITLTGLAFMITSYAVMWYHVPTLESDPEDDQVPRWIFLLNGIAILIYQTLDNMDGKQARRTGNSSPLGLLFDHGCDAVNSLFGSANWMVAMALHPVTDSYLCWSMLMGPYGLFFIGTWEEYYTGQLIMPIVNGPNEGLLGATLMSFTSWYFGPAFWHGNEGWNMLQPVLETILPTAWLPTLGLRNADLLVLASSIGFVQEIGLKTVSVVRSYGVKALWKQLPFATLVLCSLLVGWTDMNVWLDNPRTSLHLCAALFVEMTTDLMLAHITEQDYQCFRWVLLPLVVLTAAVVSGQATSGDTTSNYLLVYATAASTYLALKTMIVIHEICTVLNIWCFDIVTPRRLQTTGIPTNGHAKSE